MHEMTPLADIRGIIFDYGGTLDTGGDHWVWVFLEAYAKAGISMTFNDFREAYIHGERTLASMAVPAETTFRQLLEHKVAAQLRVLDLPPSLLPCIVDFSHSRARQATAGAVALLQNLHLKYKLAVVSNFYGNLSSVLEEMGLGGCFDAVIDSTAVGVRKPDSEIFRIGCHDIDLPPEHVLVIGDSENNDILPASAIGCLTAHIPGRGWPEKPAGPTAAAYEGTISEIARLLI